MKQVIINKCDFCRHVSFYKSNLNRHEKKCFYNPATKSCATCLWFSPLYSFHEFQCYPIRCFAKKIKEIPEDYRMKLKTKCKKWMNIDIYFMNETKDNQNEMEEKLLSGQQDYFKALHLVNDKARCDIHSQIKF